MVSLAMKQRMEYGKAREVFITAVLQMETGLCRALWLTQSQVLFSRYTSCAMLMKKEVAKSNKTNYNEVTKREDKIHAND